MRSFCERRRKFVCLETGLTSRSFVDVLPGSLTLNRDFVQIKKGQGGKYAWAHNHRLSVETLFREVEIVPSSDLEWADLGFPPRGSVGPEAYFQAIEKVIEEHWRPGQFHVMMHSSGYDSRLISALIRNIWLRRGDDWLGDVLFICNKWEGSAFRRIMALEGWRSDQYWVCREDVCPELCYAEEVLDFRGAWKRLGGVARLPVNLFWYPIAELQAVDKLPDDEGIDMWSGHQGNLMTNWVNRGGLDATRGYWCQRAYYHNWRMAPHKAAAEFTAYMHLDVVRVAGGLETGTDAEDHQSKRYRRMLGELVLPGSGAIENINALGDEKRRIAKHLMAKAYDTYSESWYGRTVAPGVPLTMTTQFSNWWEHWTSASLCEHLLRQGHLINA